LDEATTNIELELVMIALKNYTALLSFQAMTHSFVRGAWPQRPHKAAKLQHRPWRTICNKSDKVMCAGDEFLNFPIQALLVFLTYRSLDVKLD
jgi:hypothetical protein